MQDRLFEDATFARLLDLHRYQRPVVLAPHPDDEVYGCGGLLALWASGGVRARVLVLTLGAEQLGDGVNPGVRKAESEAAAELLGHELQVAGWPDRGLRCNDELIGALQAALLENNADVVLAPALTEPHPDHQATSLALVCALARMGSGPDVLFYESGGTLTQAQVLVDISDVADRKLQAMQLFDTQEKVHPYAQRIRARDQFRALTLGPDAQYAEAFGRVVAGERGWPGLLTALEPLLLHARAQAAAPVDVPLVSVLIRTVGDAHLANTVASVAAQTHARLQVVIVAAHGNPVDTQGLHTRGGMSVEVVCTGERLNRPRAANAALDAARGEYLIFLDDDDLWSPDHVQRLLHALQMNGVAAASHSDVQVIDADGRELTRYDQPCTALRLTFTNVLPIHSVLFDRRLVVDKGCRFDPELPVLEDWDFWLQVSSHTDVLHVQGTSAFYRYEDRSNLRAQHDAHYHAGWRHKVLSRWLARWPAQRVPDAALWYAQELDAARQQLTDLQEERGRLMARSAELDETAARAGFLVADLRTELILAGRQIEGLLEAHAHDLDALRGSNARELGDAARALSDAVAKTDSVEQLHAAAQLRLGDVERELSQARASLAHVAVRADAAEQRCNALQRQNEDLRVELQQAGQALAVMAARADAAEQRLRQIQASRSWRMMAPLRWVARLLRG